MLGKLKNKKVQDAIKDDAMAFQEEQKQKEE